MDLAPSTQEICNTYLNKLIGEYSISRKPINVNFRSMVDWVPYNTDRYTHLLHPYPAKLIPHIPHFFLNTDLLPPDSPSLLDPFSGSGTVMLEGTLAGARVYGADANPFARLLSKVKTTHMCRADVAAFLKNLNRRWESLSTVEVDVVNLNYWYHKHVIVQLAKIKGAITRIRKEEIRDFLLICLSATAKKVSLTDPRVSVPVKINPQKYDANHPLRQKYTSLVNKLKRVNVLKVFESVVEKNCRRVSKLPKNCNARSICYDARSLTYKSGRKLRKHSIDLVITSPPYAGAQKYIRSSSLSLGWLGMISSDKLREIENKNIGREHYSKSDYSVSLATTNISKADEQLNSIYQKNPLRAHIAANYLNEMRDALNESIRVLKPNGHMVLVCANNTICGDTFHTKEYLNHLMLEGERMECILELEDDIKSRGLMTKRNKTANTITSEAVFIYRKI